MTGLTMLWLPILLSAVLVFLVSFLVHMLLPWHKGDYRAVPNEDQVRDALRRTAIPPGDYMVPRPWSTADMRSPEFTAKLDQGPNVVMTVMPNLAVFRFAGATAFTAHAFALWPISIWYRRSWGTTVRSTIDGLLYGCLAAGVFGWLWPR